MSLDDIVQYLGLDLQANSVVIRDVQAPAWLHKYIIGKKGESVKKITADLPKVCVD